MSIVDCANSRLKLRSCGTSVKSVKIPQKLVDFQIHLFQERQWLCRLGVKDQPNEESIAFSP